MRDEGVSPGRTGNRLLMVAMGAAGVREMARRLRARALACIHSQHPAAGDAAACQADAARRVRGGAQRATVPGEEGAAVTEHIHVSRDGFLLYLLDGWLLPFVVEPSRGHHGGYSITLWRAA